MPKRARELEAVETTGDFHSWVVAGLALQIGRFDSRSWVFRYRHNGRRREAGLGPYPDVPLARARDQLRRGLTLLKSARPHCAVI